MKLNTTNPCPPWPEKTRTKTPSSGWSAPPTAGTPSSVPHSWMPSKTGVPVSSKSDFLVMIDSVAPDVPSALMCVTILRTLLGMCAPSLQIPRTISYRPDASAPVKHRRATGEVRRDSLGVVGHGPLARLLGPLLDDDGAGTIDEVAAQRGADRAQRGGCASGDLGGIGVSCAAELVAGTQPIEQANLQGLVAADAPAGPDRFGGLPSGV